MAVKVGINGFGRIGRNIFRSALGNKDIEFVAVNDLTTPATLAHLLKYDSVLGKLSEKVSIAGDCILIGDRPIRVFAAKDPAELDWIAERIKALVKEGMAIIVVEHLMGFIEHITDRVIVMNAGKEIFEGKLAVAVKVPQVIEVFLGGEHAA